jgi:hypothetical protein
MINDKIVGVVLGAVVCALVIVGNVRRGDAHLVSVYPDVVSVAVAPLVIYGIGRRRRLNGESSDSIQAFGARVGAIAGAVFAVGLAAFAFYWLAAVPPLVFGTAVAFGSVFLLASFSAHVAAHKRISAV